MKNSITYDDGITIQVWKSQEDVLDDVLFMMNESSTKKISADWLKNKLSWGRGGIATLAYDGNLPVGLVLFGTAPYTEFNRSTDVLLALYNYVSSNYRGRGIYHRLLTALNEACEAEGFELALVYPNSMARPGVRKNGWTALAPMHAYIHLPSYWRLKGIVTRMRKLLSSRRSEFVPIHTSGIDVEDAEKFASRSEASQGLQFAQSTSALQYRFNSLRGPGYQVVHGDQVSAVVRVGHRGLISEVQVMATAPRRIKAREWRQLLRLVRKTFEPDMISRIESNSQASSAVFLASGFLKLREVTIPFWKDFQGKSAPIDPVFRGIDIHTW